MMTQWRKGTIPRLFRDGYVYVCDSETHQVYIAVLAKTVPLFRGETPQELGFRPDSPIYFELDGEQVTRIFLRHENNYLIERLKKTLLFWKNTL